MVEAGTQTDIVRYNGLEYAAMLTAMGRSDNAICKEVKVGHDVLRAWRETPQWGSLHDAALSQLLEHKMGSYGPRMPKSMAVVDMALEGQDDSGEKIPFRARLAASREVLRQIYGLPTAHTTSDSVQDVRISLSSPDSGHVIEVDSALESDTEGDNGSNNEDYSYHRVEDSSEEA